MAQNKISIHAPIVGCDAVGKIGGITVYISIHAPIVGCDGAIQRVKTQMDNISIHAPIVGCDS